MPTLVLKSLKCNKTQDSFGSDDPYLCVDSKKVWGPIKAKAGETLIINENRNLIIVQLYNCGKKILILMTCLDLIQSVKTW